MYVTQAHGSGGGSGGGSVVGAPDKIFQFQVSKSCDPLRSFVYIIAEIIAKKIFAAKDANEKVI